MSFGTSASTARTRRRRPHAGFNFKQKLAYEIEGLCNFGTGRNKNIHSSLANTIITIIFQAMTKSLRNEERVCIAGFGTFTNVHFKQGYTKVKFRASPILRKAIREYEQQA